MAGFFSTFSPKLKGKKTQGFGKKLKVLKKLKLFMPQNSMQRRHFWQKLNFKIKFDKRMFFLNVTYTK